MQFYGYENKTGEQNNLLHTIELPKNLRYLQNKLPKSKYNEPLVNFGNLPQTNQQDFSQAIEQKVERPSKMEANIKSNQRPTSQQHSRNSVEIESKQKPEYDPKKYYQRPSSQAPQSRINELQESREKQSEIRNSVIARKEKEDNLINLMKRQSQEKVPIVEQPSRDRQIEIRNSIKREKEDNQILMKRQSQQGQEETRIKEYQKRSKEKKIEEIDKTPNEESRQLANQKKRESLEKNNYQQYYQQYLKESQELQKNRESQVLQKNRESQELQKNRESQVLQKNRESQELQKNRESQELQKKKEQILIDTEKAKSKNNSLIQQEKKQPTKDNSRIQRIFSAKVRYDYNKQNDPQTQKQLLNEYNANALNVIKEENQNYYKYQYQKYQLKNKNLNKLQQSNQNNDLSEQIKSKEQQPKINQNYLNYFINENKNLHKQSLIQPTQNRIFSALPIYNNQNQSKRSEIEHKIQELENKIKQKEKQLELRRQNREPIPRQIQYKERVSNDFLFERKPLRNNPVINSLLPRIQSAQVNNRPSFDYANQYKKHLENDNDKQKLYDYQQQLVMNEHLQIKPSLNEHSNQQPSNYRILRDNRNIQSAQQNLRKYQYEKNVTRQQRGLNILNCFNSKKLQYLE